jgi:hypothetical protein
MPYTLESVQNTMDKLVPPSIILYGVEKIGKSSFAAKMDTPIFIQTESGLNNINTAAFPLCKTDTDNDGNVLKSGFEKVLEQLTVLATEYHNYKTVVIDSLDWLEPLIWDEVCKQTNTYPIERVDGGFGKGYAMAVEKWKNYFEYLDYLRTDKGMTVLQIAHSKIKETKSPDSDTYDKFTIKLQDGKNVSAADKLFEYADVILFANYKTNTVKEKIGKDMNRNRAIGTGSRVLYTEERPAFKAGNRYNFPAEVPFDKDGVCWQTMKKSIPFFNQAG